MIPVLFLGTHRTQPTAFLCLCDVRVEFDAIHDGGLITTHEHTRPGLSVETLSSGYAANLVFLASCLSS